MLALLISFLIALYLLGPDLISRWILGFVVPRRNLIQSRGEEVTRAILWAAIPLSAAVASAVTSGVLRRIGNTSDLRIVFSGIYSDSYFQANQQQFFISLRAFSWMNLSLLWRLYALVVAIALVFNLLILRYNRIWHRYPYRWVRFFLTSVILPRISEWHVLLSGMRLPPGRFVLTADLLTKTNTLYQGRIQDKMLNPDGSLHTITLANPRRFLRDEFHAQLAINPDTESADYWKSIPGNLFVMMGADIVNLNLKYVRQRPVPFTPAGPETEAALSRLLDRVNNISSTR